MRRTRVALLNGARAAVEHNGLAITMAEVAARSGVAKATLYNHFRTREDVLDALLTAEVTELVAECAGMSLGDGLRRAGMRLAHHPLVRALARQDPRSVLALARVDVTCDGWRLVRDVIAERLICDGYDGSIGAGVLLRWLAGCLVAGGPDAVIEAEVDVLLTGLPRVRCASSAPSS
jgi:AcrR family transcriptional regulator